MLYLGCPMWGYKAWVGDLFPPRTPASAFLRLYSRKFNTVEGNTIFYSLPTTETIARWVQETPETFRFCPKVLRDISHTPALDVPKQTIDLFVQRMRGLGTRCGPIFMQLPPTFTPAHLPRLQAFLDSWPNDLRLAVEIRHADFFQAPHEDTLNNLLSTYNVARVMMDIRPLQTGNAKEQRELLGKERKPALPLHPVATTDFTFLRYIGHPDQAVNEPFLQEWAAQLGQWHQHGRTLYVFCHCPYEEHSPAICVEFYQQIRKQIPLPPQSWQLAKADTPIVEQGRLF
jgi:uncharacterized protein YecE (DUF72 family)